MSTSSASSPARICSTSATASPKESFLAGVFLGFRHVSSPFCGAAPPRAPGCTMLASSPSASRVVMRSPGATPAACSRMRPSGPKVSENPRASKRAGSSSRAWTVRAASRGPASASGRRAARARPSRCPCSCRAACVQPRHGPRLQAQGQVRGHAPAAGHPGRRGAARRAPCPASRCRAAARRPPTVRCSRAAVALHPAPGHQQPPLARGLEPGPQVDAPAGVLQVPFHGVAQPQRGLVDPAGGRVDAVDQELGRRGRRLAGLVGHQVGDAAVDLVADGRDHRHRAAGDRLGQVLLVEPAEVGARAAAAGDHDHVDAGGRQPGQRRHDLGLHLLALHPGAARDDPEGPAGLASSPVRKSCSAALPARGDQAHAQGQVRQRQPRRCSSSSPAAWR